MRGPWKAFAVALAASAVLTACTVPTTPAGEAPPTRRITAPNENYPNVPVVTWDAKSEQTAKVVTFKAMTAFARPTVDERTWFTDLAPILAPDYQVEAQYIDPARITVSAVKAGPTLTREQQNPLTATALFETNNGQWIVSIHRTGQAEPWLVTAIAPKTPK